MRISEVVSPVAPMHCVETWPDRTWTRCGSPPTNWYLSGRARLSRGPRRTWERRICPLGATAFGQDRGGEVEPLEGHPQAKRQLPDEDREECDSRPDGVLLIDPCQLPD